jgi:hypothetical protein
MHHASRRIILLVATAVTLAAVPVASAQARVLHHVTGVSSTVTASSALTGFLAAHSIKVSTVGRATISGRSLTLPIVGGTVKTPRPFDGRLIMAGGVRFTRNGRSITLRAFVATRRGSRNAVTAQIGQTRLIVAHATDAHISVSGKTGTITGELKLSAAAARAINNVAGHHVVTAGADLGSFTSTVTVA